MVKIIDLKFCVEVTILLLANNISQHVDLTTVMMENGGRHIVVAFKGPG
jgi:hypothetical protein